AAARRRHGRRRSPRADRLDVRVAAGPRGDRGALRGREGETQEMTFHAFRVFEENGAVRGRVSPMTLDDLSAGDVVIDAAYSSVNYKDALAGTGTGKIIRRFPLVGGIDVAGTVASSSDPRFRAGQPVLVTGFDLGVAHDGGYAQKVRVPAAWVVPIPDGLTT